MTRSPASAPRALTLLWLAGNGLRLTLLAVPPVFALILLDLQLTGTQVGVLNAIPVFLFGLVAVPGSLLIARVGAVPALVIGLLIAAAGSALRALAFDASTLFAATILMSAGVAVMQPALPTTVRQWSPDRVGFATAVYTNGLLCGEIFPVLLAGFVLPLVGGWRGSLTLWSLPLVAIAIAILLWQPRSESGTIVRSRKWMPDWRDPLLWKLSFLLGGINQLYFCVNAFLPGHLLHAGYAERIPAALTALNLSQLPASLVLLVMSSRWERNRSPLLVAGFLGFLGVVGLWFPASLVALIGGAALVGCACAIVLTLALALPALLVPPDDVSRMSAGMFTVGYGMAMTISIVGGIVWDLTQNPAFALIPVAIAVLFVVIFTLAVDLQRRPPREDMSIAA